MKIIDKILAFFGLVRQSQVVKKKKDQELRGDIILGSMFVMFLVYLVVISL